MIKFRSFILVLCCIAVLVLACPLEVQAGPLVKAVAVPAKVVKRASVATGKGVKWIGVKVFRGLTFWR